MEAIIFAFLGRFLVGAAQGVGGNLATPLITAPVRYVRERLSAAPAAAQLVEREVAVALLRATGVACRKFRRQIRSVSRHDRHALREWFFKADDFILNETARARRAEPGSLPPVTAPEDAESVEALRAVVTGDDLDRPGVASSAANLAGMMEAYLASHLGPVPDQFHALLVSPWPMSGISRAETDWFQTATALFNQRLRSDEPLRTAVTNLLLTDLSMSVDALTTAVTDHSSEAMSRIGDAMASLSGLEADLAVQSESVTRIERWVSKLLEVALLQELPGDRAVTVPDVLEALRYDAGRSARGRWAMDRSEERVSRKAAGFVGREQHLDELDHWLDAQVSGICVVAGRAGIGKSSLLAHWIRTRQGADVYYAYHFFSQSTRPLSEWTRGIDSLIRQIRAYREDGERVAGPDRPEDELYDLISQDGMRAQPLVIVIDAVEESDEKDLTDLPFPKELPDNVYVVVSVRAAEGESPPYLSWAEHLTVNRVDLRPFSVAETADYLAAHSPALAGPGAAERVHERTTGYPLFTGYLVATIADELPAGGDLTSLLASIPRTFSAYVKAELQRALPADLHDAAWSLLVTLAVAIGPLRGAELRKAAGIADVSFDTLLSRPQLARWIRTEQVSGEPEYALDHPAIGEAMRESYAESAAGADSALIECCRQWWPLGSGYALRYYPSHLLRRARRDPAGPDSGLLYALIEEEEFTACQERVLPDERDLPLRAILTGVHCAIDRLETARAIALALRYSWTRVALSRISPLSEQEPAAAWRLADLSPTSRRSLWLLLLAWREVIRGDAAAAAQTLEHLIDGEIGRLAGPDAEAARLILTGLGQMAALDQVAERLLYLDARTQLLIDTARLREAEAAALSLPDRGKRSDMLEKIANAWADDNQFAEADRVIQIKREQDRIPGFPDLDIGLLGLYRIEPARAEHVAAARRRGETSQGTFDEPDLQIKVDVAALEGRAAAGSSTEPAALREFVHRADSIDDPHDRASALAEVGEAQARAGDTEGAAATFALALAAALASTSGQQSLAGTVWRVADRHAACMGSAAASRALARAELEATRVDPEWQRSQALSQVAWSYARAGSIGDAERLLADITNPSHRAGTLLAIARHRPSTQRSRAIEEIGLALHEAWRVAGADGVAPIVGGVVAYASAGERERARSTLREACERIAREDGPSRAPRLLALARKEIELGVPDFAVEALTALLLGPPPDARWRAGIAEALTGLAEAFEPAGRQSRAADLRTAAARLVLSLPPGSTRIEALARLIPAVGLNEPAADLDEIVSAAVGDFTAMFGSATSVAGSEASNERFMLAQQLRGALLEVDRAEVGQLDAADMHQILGWPDPQERQWALTRRVELLAERGRFAEAEEAAGELEDPSSRVWAWSAIRAARLRLHDRDGAGRAWRQAQAAALQIPELPARVDRLTWLASAQLDAGFTDLARTVLTEARDALKLEAANPPERPQSQSLRLAAEAIAIEARELPPDQTSSQLAGLVSRARAISPSYAAEQAKALMCIAAVQGRAGLAAEADATLGSLRTDYYEAKREDRMGGKPSMLPLARAEAAMGHREHARADITDEIAQSARERFSSLETRVRSMAGIVSAAARIGLVSEAEDARRRAWAMAQEAADARQQVTVTAAIAEHEQLAGYTADADQHFADAQLIAGTITAAAARIRALIELGGALGRARRADEALAALSDAVTQADTLQQAMTRVEALSALADWQLELGQAAPAAQTASRLTASARDLSREPHRWQHDNPLRRAVGVVARINGREQAAAFELEVLPNEWFHHNAAKAVVDYAVNLAKAGDLDHARELLGTEPFAWGWWKGLEAIADALTSRNELAEASEVYARAAEAAQRDPGLETHQAEETVARQLLEIALLFARLGDTQTALSLIRVEPGAADPPQVADKYQVPMARILALTGLPQAAEQLLDQALETAESERERDRQVADIAEVQAVLPDAARFLATIQQISNPAITAGVLGRVAARWARGGRIPQALQLAGQIHADQAQTIMPLARELARAERLQELLELVGRYPEGEFSLAISPILAQTDPGSLDGIADALLHLSATPGG